MQCKLKIKVYAYCTDSVERKTELRSYILYMYCSCICSDSQTVTRELVTSAYFGVSFDRGECSFG